MATFAWKVYRNSSVSHCLPFIRCGFCDFFFPVHWFNWKLFECTLETESQEYYEKRENVWLHKCRMQYVDDCSVECVFRERFWLLLVLEFRLCSSWSSNCDVVWPAEDRREKSVRFNINTKRKQNNALRVHVKQRELWWRKRDTLKRAQTSQWSQNAEMNNSNNNKKKSEEKCSTTRSINTRMVRFQYV